jgi:hypothetical protein
VVYAFAIDGLVHYVGLAATSVRRRLGFYRKPGASQRTNIRLNDLMRGKLRGGAVVEILLAHPPDQDWNGLRIKGAEGLEAGLIEHFDLPWNMRGSQTKLSAPPANRRSSASKLKRKLADRILEIVRARDGMSELDIAKAIYGPTAVQQQVNQDCRLLVSHGLIERRGKGGRSDPFTYSAKC